MANFVLRYSGACSPIFILIPWFNDVSDACTSNKKKFKRKDLQQKQAQIKVKTDAKTEIGMKYCTFWQSYVSEFNFQVIGKSVSIQVQTFKVLIIPPDCTWLEKVHGNGTQTYKIVYQIHSFHTFSRYGFFFFSFVALLNTSWLVEQCPTIAKKLISSQMYTILFTWGAFDQSALRGVLIGRHVDTDGYYLQCVQTLIVLIPTSRCDNTEGESEL